METHQNEIDYQESFEAIPEVEQSIVSEQPEPVAQDRAMKLKIDKYWEEFCQFYTCFVKDISYYYKYGSGRRREKGEPQDREADVDAQTYYMRLQVAKYRGNLARVPEISQNLLRITRILKREH